MSEPKIATKEALLAQGIHSSLLKDLVYKTGYRFPFHDEWNEDFGLGYANRLAWEAEGKSSFRGSRMMFSEEKETTKMTTKQKHEIQASYRKFLAGYSGTALMKKHDLSEVGFWKVVGEDPNCDFGGSHSQPFIGVFKGRLRDVIYHAVGISSFWQWGSGGDITKVDVLTVPVFEEVAIVKENNAFKEAEGWIWYDANGKDFGPFETEHQAETLGPLHAAREERTLRRNGK